MARHSAVPDAYDRKRIRQGLGRPIEKNKAEAPTDYDAERDKQDEVADFVRRQFAVATLRQPPQEEKSKKESEQIRKSVPANAKVLSKLDHERTEIIEVICDQADNVDQPTNDAEEKSLLAQKAQPAMTT
jgi:hypothetical protein